MIFDVLAAFNKINTPENQALIQHLPEYFEAWGKFMTKLNRQLDVNEAALDRVETQLHWQNTVLDEMNEKLTLLMSESNLTPEMHEGVLAMASLDPRQQDVTRNAD